MPKVKMFAALTVVLSIMAGFANGTTQAAVVSPESGGCLTMLDQHQQDLAHLKQLVQDGYTLTNHAKLIQAGIAVNTPHQGISANLLATQPRNRTQAMQPPQFEDGGSGGYYAYYWYGLSVSGTHFPYGIRIDMNCPNGRGAEAWTGSPPGDRQGGMAVHYDGGVSNPATAGCPWYSYSNCVYQWTASAWEGSGVSHMWIAGLYTYPMFLPGWTHCM